MKYTPTIGIETHVQLKTKTKLFSAVGNDAAQALPNTLISHIDVGMPGALPVLNQKALELAAKAAFALNTTLQKFSKFDRKHYFYPDLPKGYQISQYEDPIIKGGFIELPSGTKVGITRAHLEEDAGKNTHPTGAEYSLVDLNRAGTPLLEIVSEPGIHSAQDAKAYARELYLLMKYAGVSDCDLYLGHMRFDVNVSVSADKSKPGIRAEVKNLNSFKAVEAAVEYEIKRQAELLEKGEKVVQETRGWDDAKQKTTSQRSKEEAEDYRYMPEPDIPPIELDQGFIEEQGKKLSKLPNELREILNKLSIDKEVIEDVLDKDRTLPTILEVIDKTDADNVRRIVFWLLQSEREFSGASDNLIKLAEMMAAGELSSTAAKTIFDRLCETDAAPQELARELNLLQVSDMDEIDKIVTGVIAQNPQAAKDIKNGETRAIGFLVGQVMQKSAGTANPGLAQQAIKKHLGVS